MTTTYVVAYLLIFLSANTGKDIDVHRLALEACQRDYPQGKLELNVPLVVINPHTGVDVIATHVWRCMRPIKKA